MSLKQILIGLGIALALLIVIVLVIGHWSPGEQQNVAKTMSVEVGDHTVTVTGAANEYVRIGDEGSRITFRFCPECGTTVLYTIDRLKDVVAIPVGAFADPTFPGPMYSIYEDRKHGWVSMPAGVERIG